MKKKIYFLLLIVFILIGVYIVKKYYNVNHTSNIDSNQVKDLSIKKWSGKKDSLNKENKSESSLARVNSGNKNSNALTKLFVKKISDEYTMNLYLSPNQNLYEREDDLRMDIYNKFNSKKFFEFSFLALLRGDYWEIDKVIDYYKVKFGKNILSGFKLYTYYINVKWDIDKIFINWRIFTGGSKNLYVYKTYFPYNFNIILYKKWCVPKIYKKIWYVDEKKIDINFDCIKLKYFLCDKERKNIKKYRNLKIWEFSVDLDQICQDNSIYKIWYVMLNHDGAKKLGYLDLPVFDEFWYKLLAQWFNSYGMPIVILYDKNWNIVNKCFWIYYTLNWFNKDKLEKIQESRYFDAVYWQKHWFPWWWNLDLKRWIWYAWYQEIYDMTKKLFMVKYCYKF